MRSIPIDSARPRCYNLRSSSPLMGLNLVSIQYPVFPWPPLTSKRHVQAASEEGHLIIMYAIVRIAGKQYQAEESKTLVVEKLPYEVGVKVDFDDVLLVSDGSSVQVGQPTVDGVTVTAEVVEQFKGKKIIVFKYKKTRIGYRRKQGHRQQYTRLLVTQIGGGAKKKAARKSKSEAASEE